MKNSAPSPESPYCTALYEEPYLLHRSELTAWNCFNGHLQSQRNDASDETQIKRSWPLVACIDIHKTVSYLLLDQEALPERWHTTNNYSDGELSANLALVFKRQSLLNHLVITSPKLEFAPGPPSRTIWSDMNRLKKSPRAPRPYETLSQLRALPGCYRLPEAHGWTRRSA